MKIDRPKRQREFIGKATSERDAWLCGYAAALSALDRLFDQPTLVRETLIADGLTTEMLAHAGAERFDISRIRAAVRK